MREFTKLRQQIDLTLKLLIKHHLDKNNVYHKALTRHKMLEKKLDKCKDRLWGLAKDPCRYGSVKFHYCSVCVDCNLSIAHRRVKRRDAKTERGDRCRVNMDYWAK